MRISKSKFVAGVQCLKRLYFQVHQPELAQHTDAATEAIIEQGRKIGMVARRMFPGGIEVRAEGGLDNAIRETRDLVANREVPAIFEGVFEHAGVLVRVDILHRRRDGRWRLIEVKSSTDVKEQHEDDMGIQYRVLRRSGLDVASACLAHVNRNYVYPGGDIDVRRFFKIRNVTRRVEKVQHDLTFRLRTQFAVLNRSEAPDIAPGRHCTDPVTCEFYERCNHPIPDDHVVRLPRIHASAMDELEEMGIESIREIPDDFELSEIQRRAATCVQTGEPWFDRDGLALKMASLRYPIAYLDFETINPAIPRFADTHPYQQLPFQWSVHIQQGPGAEPQHYEFLATDASDPRRDFITSLCAALGDNGSIVVYSSFEFQRLAELASWFPEFAERINAIQDRLFDLLPVVREHVYHPAFAGSYSIKSVLPALVPEMTYDGMEVANGRDAGVAWEALTRGTVDPAERERTDKALRAYCKQDTLALVRLLDDLRIVPRNS